MNYLAYLSHLRAISNGSSLSGKLVFSSMHTLESVLGDINLYTFTQHTCVFSLETQCYVML